MAHVAVLVGSLRKDSWTRRVANALIELAPPALSFQHIEIGHLPLYNQDLEHAVPEPWREFRDQVRPLDAVLFATPEYNRSVPGLLKNAIDIGSRPYGKSVWSGKPAGVVSVTPGALGAFGANHHLRQMLVFLDMPAMQQPEMYIAGADKLLDAEGKVASDGTKAFFKKFMDAFEVWIEHNHRAR